MTLDDNFILFLFEKLKEQEKMPVPGKSIVQKLLLMSLIKKKLAKLN